MKTRAITALLLLMTLFTESSFAAEASGDGMVVSFAQDISDKSGEMVCASPQTDMAKAASAGRGVINLVNINNSVPADIMSAARAAADMWEVKLKNKVPIFIGISYENLKNSKRAFSCDVIYYLSDICKPSSLLAQSGLVYGTVDSPDAVIHINNQLNWDSALNPNSTSKGVNAYTAISRGIAQSLGFGTTLTTETGKIDYRFNTKSTPFNNLIFSSDGVWLKNLSSQQEIAKFAQPTSSKIYVLKKNDNYMLYAPAVFEDRTSLVYLNNRNSLMHYAFGNGDKYYDVDQTVIDILNSIGWNASASGNITIEPSRGIDDNGEGNVYEKFSLQPKSPSGTTISNPKWKVYLTKDSGDRILYKEFSSKLLLMDLIPNPENYVRADGFIHGEAVFECSIDGKNVVPQPYHFVLNMKPGDISITYDWSTVPLCYVNFSATVHQKGATDIMLEYYNDYEDQGSGINVKRYRDEDFDIFLEKELYDDGPCVFKFTFKNDYGSTIKTIRFDPTKPNGGITVSRPSHDIIEAQMITSIVVYDIDGNYIGTFGYQPGCEYYLGQGTFVINYMSDNGVVQTKKFIIH